MSHRVEQLAEGVTLILGDCRDVLPTLAKVDAVVTDPPYGIDIARRGTLGTERLAPVRDYGKSDWDKNPPAVEIIGIEIEPKYFDIACRRISEALKQPDLFIEKPKPLRQEALEL